MSAPLTSLLSDANLKNLRAGYDPAVAYAAALGSLVAPMPGAEPWVMGAGAYFFHDQKHMRAERRELCVLSMLTVLRAPDQLAIHVYWGLMVGLGIDDVANAIFLGGDYGGVAAYHSGLAGCSAALRSMERTATVAGPVITAAVAAAPAGDAVAGKKAHSDACRAHLGVGQVVGPLSVFVAQVLAGLNP